MAVVFVEMMTSHEGCPFGDGLPFGSSLRKALPSGWRPCVPLAPLTRRARGWRWYCMVCFCVGVCRAEARVMM